MGSSQHLLSNHAQLMQSSVANITGVSFKPILYKIALMKFRGNVTNDNFLLIKLNGNYKGDFTRDEQQSIHRYNIASADDF